MGRRCGYLTTMAALAGGAERVYLHETGVDLPGIQRDLEAMRAAFRAGRRLFLVLRAEGANDNYTGDVLARLFAEESEGLFDVRSLVLGHVQQGGAPSPFDRILAVRLVTEALDVIAKQRADGRREAVYLGSVEGELRIAPLARLHDHLDPASRRPTDQWWLSHLPTLAALADRPQPDRPQPDRPQPAHAPQVTGHAPQLTG
jgi:6-phosphofructokinase 1